MPNGGYHNICAHCKHLIEGNLCALRKIHIPNTHWTLCRNFNNEKDIEGPLIAVIGQVKDGGIAYGTIPYFNGQRADTIQKDGGGDTVVRIIDLDGRPREFDTVDDYLEFYEKNKKE